MYTLYGPRPPLLVISFASPFQFAGGGELTLATIIIHFFSPLGDPHASQTTFTCIMMTSLAASTSELQQLHAETA